MSTSSFESRWEVLKEAGSLSGELDMEELTGQLVLRSAAHDNNATQLDVAKALKQLAECQIAMKEEQLQHNRITKLQMALLLAENGQGSFAFRDYSGGSSRRRRWISSDTFVCEVLRAFMCKCFFFIPE